VSGIRVIELSPGSDDARRRPRPGGRPTRLTPALAAQLVAAVRETGWIRPAALRCGVHEAVVREWVQRGKGEHPTRGTTREYAAFAADIARAQGKWEAHQLAVLDAAAARKPESWGAAAWKLERFDREQYGRHDRVDVAGTLTVVEMRAFFVAVIELIERYVPEQRREAEVKNIIAVVDELTGAFGGGVVDRPSLAPVK
jgi:transposase-like protein